MLHQVERARQEAAQAEAKGETLAEQLAAALATRLDLGASQRMDDGGSDGVAEPAAEGHADEAAACTYSRHAWLLSNPVGAPADLSATEQGASTVAATLGRADGVPVDPPGLVPHKP